MLSSLLCGSVNHNKEMIMFCEKKQNSFLKTASIILIFAFLTGCASVPSSLYHDVGNNSVSVNNVDYKPSFSYQMLLAGVRLSGYKKIYADDAQSVIKRARQFNNRTRQLPPNSFYSRFIVTETKINDRPCFLVTPKQNVSTDRAVVFLYGGGFVLGIGFFHWDVIERILNELSVPVYIPLYPIFPETNPNNVISFINEVFVQVYEEYPAARIIALGDSSGACLLLSYCQYLTEINAERFPDRLILVSPAQVAGIDEVTLNEMRAIEKLDPCISIDILKNLSFIFNLDYDNESWFSTPLYGNFSRFPPVYVFTGTHDIFYPLIQPFVERVRLQGRTIELYTGIGMMHSWPYMPIASESKLALDTILEIIDRD